MGNKQERQIAKEKKRESYQEKKQKIEEEDLA